MTDNKPALVCIGEALIDFVPGQGAAAYVARVGGSPTNVAVMASALGTSAVLISRVGADWLGRQITAELTARGLPAEHVRPTPRNTGLAVVAPPQAGPPDFLMYRTGTADSEIELTERERDTIANAGIVHISSLVPTTEVGRATALEAIKIAHHRGGLVSHDVNLRPTGWLHIAAMLRSAREMIAHADIVKVTADELTALGLDLTMSTAGSKLWLVTDGDRGARLVSDRWDISSPAPRVTVVDTTGAGDAALAALLSALLLHGVRLHELDGATASDFLRKAVELGSWVVQHPGAIDHLPERTR